MRLGIILGTLIGVLLLAGPCMASDRVSYATGGILRFPNSQQSADDGNAMLEAWSKASILLHESQHGALSFFVRGKYLADSAHYAFNNATTSGVGLAYKVKPGAKSSVTFSLRHDWYRRRDSGYGNQGWRVLIDYFYLDYQSAKSGDQMLGLREKARIFKVYANLTYPDTLASGDDNVVVSGGAEYGANLAIPDSKWYLTPFVSLNASWDKDENSYNNKLQPGVGIKLRWPLPGGDVHVGLRYRGDYRWGPDTFESGPGVFVGWYSAF